MLRRLISWPSQGVQPLRLKRKAAAGPSSMPHPRCVRCVPAAIFWIHTKPFRPDQLASPGPPEPVLEPEECTDADPSCPNWAAAGECTRNPGFMRGAASTLGTCRKSCGDCMVSGGSALALPGCTQRATLAAAPGLTCCCAVCWCRRRCASLATRHADERIASRLASSQSTTLASSSCEFMHS
jgi:hypothetical protein